VFKFIEENKELSETLLLKRFLSAIEIFIYFWLWSCFFFML